MAKQSEIRSVYEAACATESVSASARLSDRVVSTAASESPFVLARASESRDGEAGASRHVFLTAATANLGVDAAGCRRSGAVEDCHRSVVEAVDCHRHGDEVAASHLFCAAAASESGDEARLCASGLSTSCVDALRGRDLASRFFASSCA